MSALDPAELLALADKWEIHVERPGAFYPEAGAWADGVEAGYSRAADELREVLQNASPERTSSLAEGSV